MKKRILSLIILALTLASVFAFASCGNKEEEINCPQESCEGVLKPTEPGSYLCDKNVAHQYKICIDEECQAIVSKENYGNYCASCGVNQDVCETCSDDKIDGLYCTECGRQVPKDQSIKDIFGKKWSDREKAISDSALILCFGMLGIFIVTGVIITFILVLNTIVEKVRQSKENKQ